MNRIERGLWFAVAIVFGSLGADVYQRYIVPKSQPVKLDHKSFIRKAAEQRVVTISCTSLAPLEAIAAAFERSAQEGELTLHLYVDLGLCEVEASDKTTEI